LERRELRAVLWNSGAKGHLHLLARISDPTLKARIEAAARLHGCDVRAGQRIRPPLSPHRLGYRVSLIHPKTAAEAVTALAPARERQRPSQSPAINSRRKSLSGRMFALLREGDREGKYPSRSEVIQALALAAVNAGLSEAWLVKVLLDGRNRAGEKIRQILADRGIRAVRQYIHRSYEKAQARFVQIPPFRNRSDVLATIDEIEHAADAMTWRGRAGATDLAVLQAHMIIARRVCRLKYGAAVREVAELSGVASFGTVSVSHRRLVRGGWLVVLQASTREAPTRYLLRLPKGSQPNTHPTGGGVRLNVRLTSALTPAAEAWRWGALGLAKWKMWRALGGQTVRQLSEQMRIRQRAVRAHLSCLTAWGLAERDSGGRWHRIEGDLGRIAKALGTAGEASRQHQRHRRDRECRPARNVDARL
jgi:DNA-binding transcriptional ArsR family regulator